MDLQVLVDAFDPRTCKDWVIWFICFCCCWIISMVLAKNGSFCWTRLGNLMGFGWLVTGGTGSLFTCQKPWGVVGVAVFGLSAHVCTSIGSYYIALFETFCKILSCACLVTYKCTYSHRFVVKWAFIYEGTFFYVSATLVTSMVLLLVGNFCFFVHECCKTKPALHGSLHHHVVLFKLLGSFLICVCFESKLFT